MQATEIDRPELSLVAWGRTARPVTLPRFLARLVVAIGALRS